MEWFKSQLQLARGGDKGARRRLLIFGAGAVVGISTAKAVILAGTLGVATVVDKLARGFLNDGKLTKEEINGAFAAVDKRAAAE